MITLVRSILSSVVQGAIQRFSGSGRTGETFAGRELFQHYGFTSRPKNGAEALVLVQGGAVFCFATDDRRYRLSLAEGEVALYTDEGDYIYFKRGRTLRVVTGTLQAEASVQADITAPQVNVNATSSCSITAPTTNIEGNLQVTGSLTVTGTVTDSLGNLTTHTHPRS